jgi:hypothetical protein
MENPTCQLRDSSNSFQRDRLPFVQACVTLSAIVLSFQTAAFLILGGKLTAMLNATMPAPAGMSKAKSPG